MVFLVNKMINQKKIMRLTRIITCFAVLALMLLPVLRYSFLAIPFADDFSYTSNIRDASQEYGSFFMGIFSRVWYEYLTQEGGMYKVFCMTAGQIAFLKAGLFGLRAYILICHVAFYLVLFWLINIAIKRSSKKYSIITVLIVYIIIAFWIINNQVNREMYTWALIQSAYVIPVITLMLGIGMYLKHIDKPDGTKSRYLYVICSAICFFLTSGSPLNIVVLNCGIVFILCYYGVRQAGKKRREWIVFGITLVGAVINLAAPGNSARHGSEWGIILFLKTLLTAFKHVLLKLGLYMSKTPFFCLCIILFLVLIKTMQYNYVGKISFDHPVALAAFFVAGATLVDWPYTFGNSIVETRPFEGRVDFVSDMTLYFLTVIWILYFVGFVKKRVETIKIKDGSSIYRLMISSMLVFSLLILLGNGLFNYTTPYMISSLLNGSAENFSDYQESILNEIQNGDAEIHITYDCSQASKKHPIIVGLELGDNPDDAGLFWRNNAVARYYYKDKIYIEYLY